MLKLFKSGGMLTGAAIDRAVQRGDISISGYDLKNMNPNSYNIKTGHIVKVYQNIHTIDPNKPDTYQDVESFDIEETGFTLRPGLLYLIPTLEEVGSDKYIPLITGRSSIGRLGISIHQEAGFGDIGYKGVWTMQVKVTYPTVIYPEMPFAQVYFITPYGKINTMYHGRYQGSKTAVGSRFNLKTPNERGTD